jgi:hypothetical protein
MFERFCITESPTDLRNYVDCIIPDESMYMPARKIPIHMRKKAVAQKGKGTRIEEERLS